jgi:hypothetical protein
MPIMSLKHELLKGIKKGYVMLPCAIDVPEANTYIRSLTLQLAFKLGADKGRDANNSARLLCNLCVCCSF